MITLAGGRITLAQSFTIAAWVVISGVVASWIVIKQDDGEIQSNLPEVPSFTLTPLEDVQEVNFIEKAEIAFAAGRIDRPQGNSALYFYTETLERDPANVEARRGVDRVKSYLVNGAENALRRSDLSQARELAAQVLGIAPDDLAAKSVVARINQLESISSLIEQAIDHIAAGRLTDPEGTNALDAYRQILDLDPGNAIALQGLDSVAQRLATIAQTEAFAENHERAAELIALAKQIAPYARGIEQTEKLTLQWTDMVKDQAVKDDLLGASQAIQQGNLVGLADGSSGALQRYQSVLKKDPKSQAARAGIKLVAEELVERAWQRARNEEIVAVEDTIAFAVDAGASDAQLAPVREELDYLKRRSKARNGEFDGVLSVRDLTAKRQSRPTLPRHLTEGWIELLFTVTEEGDVRDVLVVSSSNEDLNDTAIKSVSSWKFDPFLDNGRPLPVRSGIRFTFQT